MAKKLVFGVGVMDADYVTQPRINGKQVRCPYYAKWHHMLMRCYNAKFLAKNNTYIGCFVATDWFSFMAFRSWMEKQDWQGKHLDKDFLGGGKLYSPDTCIFISPALNYFMNAHGAGRGTYPLGVSKKGSRFQSHIRINAKGKNLGIFDTPEEAHAAWLSAKTKLANDLIASERNPRIASGIREYINRLHNN